MSPDATDATKLRQVAAALALAVDQAGMPEGDNAARIAERLMSAHGLTRDDVERISGPVERREVRCSSASWCRRLWHSAAKLCGARFLFHRGGPGGFVYGLPRDVDVAEYLYDLLNLQLEQEVGRRREGYGKWNNPNRKQLTAIRGSFSLGVAHKVADLVGHTPTHPAGEGLVLVRKEKESLIDRHLELEGGEIRAVKLSVRLDDAAFRAGRQASLRRGIEMTDESRMIGERTP